MDKQQRGNEDELDENLAKVADFVNKRLNNTFAPGALNNTVEEYIEKDKKKK